MTGVEVYRKRQIAWPTIVPLALVQVVLIPVFFETDLLAAIFITEAVYAVIMILFATLTVIVTTDGVVAAFGIGLVRKTLMFADVVSYAPVRNTWRHGWGIHYFRGGVTYNASGWLAVEFKMTNGRYVRIGTAEPDALVAALRQVADRPAMVHDPASTRGWGPQHTMGAMIGIGAAAFAAVVVYIGLQPPDTVVGFDSFYVSNGFYRNTIPYRDVQSLTLEDVLPRVGLKTNGFSAGGTLRGSFRVESWGTSRLYVNRDRPPFVVLRTADGRVVVNFKDPMETRRLYDDLKARIARSPE